MPIDHQKYSVDEMSTLLALAWDEVSVWAGIAVSASVWE
jgi:hypothetical protein